MSRQFIWLVNRHLRRVKKLRWKNKGYFSIKNIKIVGIKSTWAIKDCIILFLDLMSIEDIAQNHLSVLQTGLNLMRAFKPRLYLSNAADALKLPSSMKKTVYMTFTKSAVKVKI